MTEVRRAGWLRNGNFGIDDTIEFIGTNDAADFIIKTNNIERAKFLSTGNFNILEHTGINMLAQEKHTLAIGDPSSFESGSSFIDVFSTTAKIQSRVPDDNGLVGGLIDITTKDTPIDVTSPGFSALKIRLTNEQDANTAIGNPPIQGLDCILTNNGNLQGQPSSTGWADTACNFKLIQNGTDQETVNFAFISGRGINGEAINNYEVVSGTPIVVQLGADLLTDMTNYAESGTGAAVVLSQTAVQARCFGTTVGVGSNSTAGFFSSTGGATNTAIHAAAGRTLIADTFEHTGSTFGIFSTTPSVQAAAYTPTNVTTDRSYNANSTTVDEIADVLGTLIADLQSYGLLQ